MRKFLIIALAILGLASLIFRSGAQTITFKAGSEGVALYDTSSISQHPTRLLGPKNEHLQMLIETNGAYMWVDAPKIGTRVSKSGFGPAVADFDSTNRLMTVNGVDMREFLRLAREFSVTSSNITANDLFENTWDETWLKQRLERIERTKNREKRLKLYLEMLAKIEEVVR